MRKLLYMAAAGLSVLPVASQALDLDQVLAEKGVLGSKSKTASSEIYYDEGVHLDFGDRFKSKWNFLVTPNFTYTDADGGQDNSDFNVNRARMEVTGSTYEGAFTFGISNDFEGDAEFLDDGNDGSLRDAWLQWNPCDNMGFRFGQFVLPYGHEANLHLSRLDMINRSVVTQFFSPGRSNGVAMLGNVEDSFHYGVSVYEGDSPGDQINSPYTAGVDSKIGATGMVGFEIGEYGDRTSAGAYGSPSDDFAMLIDLGLLYSDNNLDPASTTDLGKVGFSRTGANSFVGLKVGGFSLSGEAYYQNLDLDDGGDRDDWGYNIEASWLFAETWELAGRFAHIDLEKLTPTSSDNIDEYGLVVGYYFDGHNMKVQTGPTWYDNNFDTGNDVDVTDFLYEFRLTGYL